MSVEKCFQVSIIDADQVGASGEYAREIGGVVEFDEGGHTEGSGLLQEADEGGIVEDFGDQEDGIGTGEAGFDDLVVVDQEIFA